MPTIVVLVKHVPDTWSAKTLDADFRLHRQGADEVIDEISTYAVEQALRIKEAHPDYTVVALAMGPEGAEEAVRKAIAMGVDQGVILTDPALAGSDALATAWALNNAINAIDPAPALIITGTASSDSSTGLVPGIISEYRQIPALTYLTKLALEGDQILATRLVPEGSYELTAKLPAVVSITEKADKPRFPAFKGIMAAKKAEIRRLSLADIGVDPAHVGGQHAATLVTAATTRPERSRGDIQRGEGAVAALVEFLQSKKLI